MSRIELTKGNITKLDVEAVVTAANKWLAGGGGVDGAIHDAAGPDLLEECSSLGGCPPGQARITKGYRLKAKHVIHAVGPVYETGKNGEPEMLASAYRSSLELAKQHGIRSIAFPCISTGVFGYPKSEACDIAISTVAEWVRENELPLKIVFCCYEEEDARLYAQRL
jgi:O-acetyl-ADP-ribose deacetylase (regulator of RNase III)